MTSDSVMVRDLVGTDLVALAVQRRDHVAEVTLLGPGKGNAMGPDFWRELPLVFRALDADPQVRAVVLMALPSLRTVDPGRERLWCLSRED